MLKYFIYAAAIYLALMGILYLMQRQFIYYPKSGEISPEHYGLPSVELIKLKTSDGIHLSAWYSPAREKSMPTIVYFHGNYGHMGYRASIIEPYIHAGYGVLLLSYRGYSGSTGKPSEKGLYNDGRAAINYLISQGINAQCLALYGVSLGSGVAVQMATEYDVGALILQSSFTSLVDVGKKHYFFFPVSLILKDRYESDKKIAMIKAPKLFIHGAQDNIIPLSFGRRLYDLASQPKEMLVYPKAGHNFLPDSSAAVIKFLDKYNICHPE